ncbi:PCNA-interacting partner isoform 2-T2 [Erethizon dorsatum]
MAVLNQKAVLAMIKVFRRNWRALCSSERTTLCGADSMLLVLQLAMAENNKLHYGEFAVSLSDVLMMWKYLLHEKLNLLVENMEVVDHYEDIKKIYEDFLKNSSMLDLIDVYKKCRILTSNSENKDIITPVATSFIRRIELGGKGYAPSPSDPLRKHIKGLSNFINFIDKLHEILGEIPNPSIAGGRILSVMKMQLIKGQSSEAAFCKAVEGVAQDLELRIKNIANSQHEGGALSPTDRSPAQPKSHAINHGTAYCGRDTVKTLLVLLDEEAASAPTRNKAELLYCDGNTVHCYGTSVLTLFRSPIQVDNSLMKPLRERISKSVQEKKIKMKQTLIRSQFSCTYKDDGMISRDKRNNINSCVLHVENDLSEGVDSSVGRSTIGTRSGNVHLDRSKNDKLSRKSNSQTGNKSSKRKQVDLDGENILCDNGNKPPQHKNVKIPKISNDLQKKLDGRLARVAKGSKCAAKTKLITGQTKLTQFFML